MANIMNGVEIVKVIVDELNKICKTEGGIRRNDPRIWDILHELNEQTWEDIVAALEAVHQDSASCYYPQDLEVLYEAKEKLNKSVMLGKSFVGRPMVAKSGNKYTVWRLTMIMREVVNRYNGVHIPNKPGAIEDINDLPKDPTTFNELFTQ
jgi:hypothetical protein